MDAPDARQTARFITFEGGEGAGKSTQLRLLAARLRAAGVTVVETREPGGCPMAEKLRALLVTGGPGDLDPLAECFLLLAARVEHLRTVIRPALARGAWVLCDRFSLSTLAYQGAGRGMDTGQLLAMNQWVQQGLEPERVIVLDLDPAVGLVRAAGRRGSGETRFESEALAFHQRVRAGFLQWASADPVRIRVIDGAMDPEQVAAAVWEEVGLARRTFLTGPVYDKTE
ncbi:MAG: dTMP kinase [Magnetococcales bacterium]|nr:dTMP kinase [Magnetococcales bacterium]